MKRPMKKTIASIIVLTFFVIAANGQTTEFTFQGSLRDSGGPVNGDFDLEFALFDSVSGGVQIGSTQARPLVAVAAGRFTVRLDFGNQFPGANRFIEIRVRETGQPAFTTLSPRQPLASIPYAVKTLSADSAMTATNATHAATATSATSAGTATNTLNLGGVAANQYVITSDTRLSDARQPVAGSTDYIQNQSLASQPSANFNISGNGVFGGLIGVGTASPSARISISGTGSVLNPTAARIRIVNTSSTGYSFFVPDFGTLQLLNNGNDALVTVDGGGNIGVGTLPNATTKFLVNGTVGLTLAAAGGISLCLNGSNQISSCSSSSRYKANVTDFRSGLEVIRLLRPVTFNWKTDGAIDLGLVAEDVAKVEPLLTTSNENGEIEGVKYDRLGIFLVNALIEQQLQIEAQQRQTGEHTRIIQHQLATIEALKALVCRRNAGAAICKSSPKQ
jgi:hypothetical protein